LSGGDREARSTGISPGDIVLLLVSADFIASDYRWGAPPGRGISEK
jgi:hypothetical protein